MWNFTWKHRFSEATRTIRAEKCFFFFVRASCHGLLMRNATRNSARVWIRFWNISVRLRVSTCCNSLNFISVFALCSFDRATPIHYRSHEFESFSFCWSHVGRLPLKRKSYVFSGFSGILQLLKPTGFDKMNTACLKKMYTHFMIHLYYNSVIRSIRCTQRSSCLWRSLISPRVQNVHRWRLWFADIVQ